MNDDIDSKVLRLESEIDAARTRIAQREVEIEALRDENATLIGERALSPSKTEHYERVELFHGLIRQPGPPTPSVPTPSVRLLRARLIMEEALEAIEAIGVLVTINPDPGGSMFSDRDIDVRMCDASFAIVAQASVDLPHLAKELADLSVTVAGTFVACGIKDRPVLEAVDRNNIEKVECGTFREDGKLIKNPRHQPPDMAAVLRAQGWQG